jgi:hypothetical protein
MHLQQAATGDAKQCALVRSWVIGPRGVHEGILVGVIIAMLDGGAVDTVVWFLFI